MSEIAIIGAGNMGGAIARRLAAAGENVTVTAAHQSTLDRLKAGCPELTVTTDNIAAARGAAVVILAVKPWLIEGVIREIADVLPKNGIVISVAAGVTLKTLSAMVGRDDIYIYRAIPNTPIATGNGVTFVCTSDANPFNTTHISSLLGNLGAVHYIDEGHLDAAMAVASCGVAYVLRFMRATMEGAIQLGLSATDARRWVAETMAGTAAMMLDSDAHPEAAIDQVTTPGGLTIRGLNAMEANGFSNAVISGILASIPSKK